MINAFRWIIFVIEFIRLPSGTHEKGFIVKKFCISKIRVRLRKNKYWELTACDEGH